jgi:LPXTG-site transpeptidase (sortase) family protein
MLHSRLCLVLVVCLITLVSACSSDLPVTAPSFQPTATSNLPTDTPVPPTATPRPTNTPVPTATVTPIPTPFGGGRPKTLTIPSIGVKDAPVVQVGLEPNGAMETPKGWWDIGWYKYGPIPGQPGNSVLSGHYDSDVAPAVFWNLYRLKTGDRIIVGMEDGTSHSFIVEQSAIYPFNRAPLERIFGPDDRPRLNLITCNGSFDPRNANYDKRLVVYAVWEVVG